MSAATKPTLIIHSDDDRSVPVQQAVDMVEKPMTPGGHAHETCTFVGHEMAQSEHLRRAARPLAISALSLRASRRTLWRKLAEVRVAYDIESTFSKDEILKLYLSHIYFGNGARGIEAAAKYDFGVRASQLSLAQAASLAALPKGPALFDPRRHPKEARERRDLVLALMEEQKRITPAAASRARSSPLRPVARSTRPSS